MNIDLSIPGPPPTRGSGAPIYPLGAALVVQACFTADEPAGIVLDDPRSSQKTLLRLRSPGRRERALTELNPSLVDLTGEITAPPSQVITLAAGDRVEAEVPLLRYYPDLFAVAGWYELTVEYEDTTSAPLHLGFELVPESVPLLIAIFLDEAASPGMHRRAHAVLRSLPVAPELTLALAGDDPAERCVRELDNFDRAQAFLAAWPQTASAPAMQRFFAQQRLPAPA